jgi:hypothetical protein
VTTVIAGSTSHAYASPVHLTESFKKELEAKTRQHPRVVMAVGLLFGLLLLGFGALQTAVATGLAGQQGIMRVGHCWEECHRKGPEDRYCSGTVTPADGRSRTRRRSRPMPLGRATRQSCTTVRPECWRKTSGPFRRGWACC